MKSTLMVLMLCFLIIKANAQFDRDHVPKKISDSIEVLTSYDGVICGYSFNKKDSFLNRYARINGYANNINYKMCRDLMQNNNNVKKAYGFNYALRKYPEDISPDLPIFNIKDSIKIYNRSGKGLEIMTLGNYCTILYEEKLYSDSMSIEIDKLGLAVRNFFDNNAKYPESINSNESGGQYPSKGKKGNYLQFSVTYTIKDKNGKIQTIDNQHFAFDEKGEIVFLKIGKPANATNDQNLKEAWLKKFGK